MKISDRDRKIIYILLILLVTILPYTLYIKNQRMETETIEAGNEELQARYDYLSQLDDQKELYAKATVMYNNERDNIIDGYPADIRPENYTMFLLGAEYDSYTEVPRGNEANFLLNEYHYLFNAIAYSDNVQTPISSENTDTGYVALANTSVVNYIAVDYPSFKYMIEYLLEYPEPIMYTNITMDFDEDTGNIKGEMTIAQYAIAGTGRELGAVVIWPDLDLAQMRGNTVIGVFGPKVITVSDLERMPEADAAGENVEPGEEVPEN